MKPVYFAVAVLLASGAYSSRALAHVEDADAAKVASCTFVKDVSAPTKKGKHTREALGNAMEQARADAEKAGATHVVWNKVTGSNVSSVGGKAYRCGD